jgi:DNA polymerase-1
MATSCSTTAVDLSGKTVWVIDLFSRIYQLFHALPEMTAPDGTPVSAVFGLTRDLLDIIETKQPDYLLCGSDAPGPTFRHDEFADYKATRAEMPADLVPQLPLIRRLLELVGVPCLELAGFEADDILATLAHQTAAAGGDCVLVTSDKDARQLLGPHVRLLNLRNNALLGEPELLAEWGIRPDQVVDFLALVGDAVDNVPGVPGIGPKIASGLLQEYGSLEEILGHIDDISGKKRRENLTEHGDLARRGRGLIQLKLDTPIEIPWDAAVRRLPEPGPLAEFLKELGFKSLVKKVLGLQGGGGKAAAKPDSRQGMLALGDDPVSVSVAVPATLVLPGTAAAVRAAVEDLRARTQAGAVLAVVVTESAARGRTKPGQPPVWPETTGLAVMASGDSPGAVCWFTAADLQASAPLQELLTDSAVPKVGHDLKRQLVSLARLDLTMAGLHFDTLLAGHLLDAGQRNQGLADLVDRFAAHADGGGLAEIGETPQTAAEAAVICQAVVELVAVFPQRLAAAGLASLFGEVELPLTTVLAAMEARGVRVDTAVLARLSADYATRLETLEEAAHALAGHPFSLASPMQVRTVLFDEQGLPVVKRTKTGPSTDAEVLEELAPLHELPAKLLEHRKYAKLKSTYVDALPLLVNPRTGRIHTTFNQTVTATGRLSSSEPNLQNIPIRTAEGQQIRSAFLPSEPGWQFLAADYSQIELRILAHLSGDAGMVAAFQNAEDIHTRTAVAVFEVEPSAVTAEMRRTAKAVNFGILYGQSAFGLAKSLGIAQPEAAAFIEAYFETFAGAAAFIDEVLDRCRSERGVTTMLGRRRAIEGVRDHDGRRSGAGIFALSLPERTAVNTVVQGSAADLIKLAMLRVADRLADRQLAAALVLQIHDELLLEAPEDEMADLQELVVTEMQEAMSLAVPLEVSVQTGGTWAACEK